MFNIILVIINIFIKFIIYIPYLKTIDSRELADIWYERFAIIYRALEKLVSDRGSLFTSEF